jgi:hypothetical protein
MGQKIILRDYNFIITASSIVVTIKSELVTQKLLLFLVTSFFFFFFYWWGRPEPRLSHFSLRGRLYSNPCFSSPVHFHRRSTPDGVRDLNQRKEELWQRNGR